MILKKRDYPLHKSMRGYFARELYFAMQKDTDIYVLTGDLGYGMFDVIRKEYPERFLNCMASEQAMLDIAVGLALAGKKPFVYSITPFLLYRGFETLRTYIAHERIPVRLIGGGRNRDYHIDGYSHNAEDVAMYLTMLDIENIYPKNNRDMGYWINYMLLHTVPIFLSLKR